MSYQFEPIPSRPPPAKYVKPVNGTRVAGWAFMAIWALLFALIIRFMIESYNPAFYARYGPKLWDGFLITCFIVSVSLIFGSLISLPIALGRMSKNPLISLPAYCFVYFFRGTPLIAQVFLVYYGAGTFREFLSDIGLWWFFRDAMNCVLFSFSLNTAAYQAEILRGAIENVSRGQTEAGQALGLSRFTIFRKIVLPQALIVALRPYGNEIILMIKGSAIASIVTVFDLMGETRRAFSRSFDFQIYLWAALFYLVLVETLRNIWEVLERRLTRHLKRDDS